MRDSATNLHRFLENLLQWSRLHRGMIAFAPKHFVLLEKVNNSLEAVKEIAINKGIDITIDIPEDMVVFADENMLESTVRNIATNAVKFTEKGGKVLISAMASERSGIEILIKDTGIGMPAGMIDKLFKIDQLSSRPGTNGEPSTGLGLILCKDFMDKHQGKIWVESIEHMGSAFHIFFPSKTLSK